MKKLTYFIMVSLFVMLGVVGTSSIEAKATVIVNNMDFDLNGSIGIEDLARVASNYNLTNVSDSWNSKYDLNKDNIIDIYDIVRISKVIGTATIIYDDTDITSKFIDKNFKTQVYGIIKKNSPAAILYSDVKGLISINIYSKGISNLCGIEYFTSLINLNCSNNQLTDLDLTNNTALTKLICSDNQLTTLDISKNVGLGMFGCTGNQITTLYSTKDTWPDSYYKQQYTDASHKITINNLVIKVVAQENPGPEQIAAEVVNEAKKHLGKPYLYGATGPNSFDCSGFTSYVYKTVTETDIGRRTYDQIKAGIAIPEAELKPGDLVFTSSEHVGIYVGNGMIIHSPKTGDVVKITSIWAIYACRRIIL